MKKTAQATNSVQDQIKTEREEGESQLQQLAHQAGEEFGALWAEKQVQLHKTRTNCEKMIRKHPLASTTAAFACGLLLALLMKRK